MNFIFLAFLLVAVSGEHVKLPFDNIAKLTFRKDALTTGRRLPARSQLECVGGDCDEIPDQVQCTRVKGRRWHCPADIDFIDPVVSCEGYEAPNDKDILKGSCLLRFVGRRRDNMTVNWVGVVTSFVAIYLVWSGMPRGA